MPNSLSWIDEANLQAVLREISAERAPELFGTVPTRSAGSPTTPPSASKSAEITVQAGAQSALPGRSTLPPFEVASGRFDDRVRWLVNWMGAVDHCEQAFVADQDGLPMAEVSASSDLLAASAWLVTSWLKVKRFLNRNDSSLLMVALHDRRFLYLFQMPSSAGVPINAGLVTSEMLNDADVRGIETTARAAVEIE